MTEAIEATITKDAGRRSQKNVASSGKQPEAPKKEVGKFTKADAVIALMSRARGATLDDMMMATGWQAHSVRGFISGTLKKKLGRTVTSEKTAKGRNYRIAAGDAG